MTGYDPAFAERSASQWFGDNAETEIWKQWWKRPPETEERLALYIGLANFERDLDAPMPVELAEWPRRLRDLSEVILRVLELEFEEDQAVRVSGTVTWHGLLNRRLEEKGIPLRLCPVYPGQRFDPDTMEAIASLSGNRLMVHSAQSWVIRDHSGIKARVSLRARVVTA